MKPSSFSQASLLPVLILAFLGCSIGACAAPGAQDQAYGSRYKPETIPEFDAPSSSLLATSGSAAPEDQVHVQARLGHTAYTRSMPQRIALKIDVQTLTPDPSVPGVRPALNLAILIDRSGSMREGDKFEQTMEAVGLVIENLTDRDVLSVIVFGDQALVLSPAGRVVNKAFIRHRLSEVSPAGGTNLSAGLLEAVAQIESQEPGDGAPPTESGPVRKKVLVLTDGMANRGITNAADLQEMVEVFRKREIGLSTMGVGTEFDGKLLTNLAEAGGGRYSYVRNSEGIPAAMANELEGFLAVRAQNVELSVRVGAGAEIVRVYGRLQESPSQEIVFNLGDLRDSDRGTFVLELAPLAYAKDSSVKVDVSLVGDFSVDAKRHRQTISLEALYTKDPLEVRAGLNSAVVLYADVLAALEETEEAVLAFDRDRAEQSGALFGVLYEKAHAAALETRDQELLNQTFLLKHFMTELLEADEEGMLHGHEEAAKQLGKEVAYRRYLLEHH